MTGVPADRIAARQGALKARLAVRGLDALLVTHRPNLRYLTGFGGSSGMLLVRADRLTLVSDSRYATELAALAVDQPLLDTNIVGPGEGSLEERLAAVLAADPPPSLGFESQNISVAQFRSLVRLTEAAGTQLEWTAVIDEVEELRQVKDPWELATLREAGQRLSEVAKCIIPNALAGVTERHLAAVLEWEMRQKGFDKPAFDTIVASGPNAALPHHRAGDRQLADGDLVVIDFGGMLRGYAVDMTRTVILGTPTARQRACWDAVATAQRAAFAAARVGTSCDEVDEAARQTLAAAGMEEAFSHGLGHGLGLEVHERPRLSRRRAGAPGAVIAAGMVFTLEPGVYYPGWGGVRIEDDVVATERGPEWLTEPVSEARAT